uniref:Uncharacterized protein n=1 Tax=Anopheles culicifacies TaxID=139723 RepID=A0A182M3L7_9DIPT
MAKILVFLSALFVLGAAAPQNLQQKGGTPLQERKTKMDWEQITNTIEEVFGITSDGKQQDSQQDKEQATDERKREFLERQQEGTGMENREERNREAIGRAQGRLPIREMRRRQQKTRQSQQLGEKRQTQRVQDNERDEKRDRYYNDFPLYEFAYGVHDPATGDNKEQWEKRVGDHVKGKYTLDQPDGTKRVVEYEADDKSGFEAIVKEIDRIDDRHRGDVRWGHSDAPVAQSYSKLKKVD